jgi:hypothetical protein
MNIKELEKLRDVLQTEMKNQAMYNQFMIHIQHPEIRQMFMLMREGKMQHITQLQQEINKMMAGQA